MEKPPLPANEGERLKSLREHQILDTPREGRFDRITRLARRMFEVPIVAISLVDEARQWFKASEGLDVSETPRDISFCGHAILDHHVMVVEDATADPRFADNPLVTEDPSIRFYAGQPLVDPDGTALGTLCIIDRRPRTLSDRDRLALQDLATLVETELNLDRMSRAQRELMERLRSAERQSLLDPLTQLWNRAGILRILDVELAEAEREGFRVSVAMADIDHFKSVNDTHGHAAGDRVLREAARRITTSLRASDAGGRLGGEEFAFVLPGCDAVRGSRIAERVRIAMAGEEIVLAEDGHRRIPVTVSIGIAQSEAGDDAAGLLGRADEALYRAKESGRNRVEICRTAPLAV